jgi:lipopolysaccharide/colanic/teichoic acid biosynthesis glycosyltransferase
VLGEELRLRTRHCTAIRGPRAWVKRGIDLCAAAIALPLCAPLLAGAALLIALDSRGPILYRQERAGRYGRPFKILKLRTMCVGAEEELEELVDLEQLQEPVFKLKNDPRVTHVGRFLRRWSIDELPQLVNVLLGEMSLVGPRPEETWIVARYSRWHRQRLWARPGLTGPVQVSGRADLRLKERVRLEVEYIEGYRLWRDVEILLKTVPAVIRGEGAY